MNEAFLDRVMQAAGKLSSLPQTLAEVLRVVRDERSSADQLARVMMKDPPLTAKVLRMANSPIYGTGQKIGSMIQAIRVLGDRQVTALALSTSIYDMTKNWQTTLDRMRFWRHSLETAIASRLIAEQISWKATEELFLAGLLHDFGLLVVEMAEPREFARIWNQAGKEGGFVQLEYELWGATHSEVGSHLLMKWNLPETIWQPVANHHNSAMLIQSKPEYVASQVVMLGHMISKFTITPERLLNTEMLLAIESLRTTLDLPAEKLFAIERELTSTTMREAEFLEMEIGTVDDMLMEANRLLFEQSVLAERLASENRRLRQKLHELQVNHEGIF